MSQALYRKRVHPSPPLYLIHNPCHLKCTGLVQFCIPHHPFQVYGLFNNKLMCDHKDEVLPKKPGQTHHANYTQARGDNASHTPPEIQTTFVL